MIYLKSREEIDVMARGGAIIAELFQELDALLEPGVTTAQVNALADEHIRSHDGAFPAFKGLYGFPGSVCTSINEEIVHGIPSADRVLQGGDILSVDVGVKLDGWCSDSAWTFPVGEIDQETEELLRVTLRALDAAVETTRPGKRIGDVGAAVQEAVRGSGFSIIRDLVGHGIGRKVHEEPQVPNVGRAGTGAELQEGLVLAIEPMISTGSFQIKTLEDGWTMVTVDGSRSAHYEHSVAVTEYGPRVLTKGAPDPVAADV